MATQKKIDQVQEITQQINQSEAVYLVDYKGINANQFNELRKFIKEQGGHMQVTKNTLFTIALRESEQKISLARKTLSDSTATLYAIDDPITPLKAIIKFAKDNDVTTIKTGFLQGQQLTEQKIKQLADLPDQTVLLGQVVGMLNSPIQRLVGSLNAPLQKLAIALSEIKKQKEVNAN